MSLGKELLGLGAGAFLYLFLLVATFFADVPFTVLLCTGPLLVVWAVVRIVGAARAETRKEAGQ